MKINNAPKLKKFGGNKNLSNYFIEIRKSLWPKPKKHIPATQCLGAVFLPGFCGDRKKLQSRDDPKSNKKHVLSISLSMNESGLKRYCKSL